MAAHAHQLHIACDGVASEVVIGRLGEDGPAALRAVVRDEPAHPADILVVGDVTPERLVAALARPCRSYIEFRSEDRGLPERIIAAASADGLYLTLSTLTAYRLADTAHFVCQALCQRGALPEAERSTVELALHEVLANAILHGNLGLDSRSIADDDGYRAFVDSVRSALDQERSRRLWITIAASWSEGSLKLSVADQGNGFALPDRVNMREDASTAGRGLAIVHALAASVLVTEGGRKTVMRFDYGDT